MNRHGKGGCDDKYADSACWENLDSKAGHHVWGRDENGNGFTTLLLRGRNLNRTSTFNTDSGTPNVSVENIFNDPSQDTDETGESGEQESDVLAGDFRVTNSFRALSDGVRVTHKIDSDGTDELSSAWATLPVFLKAQRQGSWGSQQGYEKTSIEYWDGSSWQNLPDSENGTPDMVNTTALRLGRNFELGQGTQYTYVDFESAQDVRLSKRIYSDPYQTRQMFRSVHIDLHGNPGEARTVSNSSVTYDIVTNM